MARRPRIEMAGFHHVLDRGVEKRDVFLDDEDHETFLSLLCTACRQYDVSVHSYCLMSNHYHLLLETEHENLSKVMRSINSQYANYFNRKQKRVGHLWQGRFKSWYVTDERYLYSLIRYIEFNPIKAKIVKELEAYPYSSFAAFSEKSAPIGCLRESLMFTQFKSKRERIEFFESWYDEDEIRMMAKASSLVVSPLQKKELRDDGLVKLFKESDSRDDRNDNIQKAVEMGFSQHRIAQYLGLSQPTISHVLRKRTRK